MNVMAMKLRLMWYKGIDVTKVKEGIELSMEDYANSIEEIQD